jgi:hypothetical protein
MKYDRLAAPSAQQFAAFRSTQCILPDYFHWYTIRINDEQFEELKRFVDWRISQFEVGIKGEIGELRGSTDGLQSEVTGLREEIADLRAEAHGGSAGVGEAVEQTNQGFDERDEEVDKRLTNLEHQIAS